ncbi:hypothetical protein ADUPG1_005447, partial [Aduncisulcus paluster]
KREPAHVGQDGLAPHVKRRSVPIPCVRPLPLPDLMVILTTDGTMIQSCVSACNATLGCGTGTCTDTSTDDDVSSWECLCPTDSYLSGSNTCISAGGVDDGCYQCGTIDDSCGYCTLSDDATPVPFCQCDDGYKGDACSTRVDGCPFVTVGDEQVVCGEYGTCDETNEVCVCDPDTVWFGPDVHVTMATRVMRVPLV